MKCPKCSYLGFETGDRCKNCGYEFSLMIDASAVPVESDLPLRPDTSAAPEATASARTASTSGSGLPLFEHDDLDAPLIRLPAAPRPPLAVRRTPVPSPRPRPTPPSVPRSWRADEPVLSFDPDTAPSNAGDLRLREAPSDQRSGALDDWGPGMGSTAELMTPSSTRAVTRAAVRGTGPASRNASVESAPSDGAASAGSPLALRAVAGLIDHGILLSIDVVVLYFTLRMTGLTADEWGVLPLAPLLTFLGSVKVAYFGTFTAVGGQTIGKMATRLRVVGHDRRPVSVARGLWRALAGLLSIVPFGVGLLPILLSAQRRAFHDHVAGTRVVAI